MVGRLRGVLGTTAVTGESSRYDAAPARRVPSDPGGYRCGPGEPPEPGGAAGRVWAGVGRGVGRPDVAWLEPVGKSSVDAPGAPPAGFANRLLGSGAMTSKLTALVVDYGGVLTSSLRETMGDWMAAERIDRER